MMLLSAIFSSPSAMSGISPYCQRRRFHSSRRHAAPYHRQDDHPRIPIYIYIFHLQRSSLGCRSHHPEQRQCTHPYTKKASHSRPYGAEHSTLRQHSSRYPSSPTAGPGQLFFPKSPLPLPCPDVTFTGVSFYIYPIWGNRSPGMFLLKSEMDESMVTESSHWQLLGSYITREESRLPCNCN